MADAGSFVDLHGHGHGDVVVAVVVAVGVAGSSVSSALANLHSASAHCTRCRWELRSAGPWLENPWEIHGKSIGKTYRC